jgi:hypothetical protein
MKIETLLCELDHAEPSARLWGQFSERRREDSWFFSSELDDDVFHASTSLMMIDF